MILDICCISSDLAVACFSTPTDSELGVDMSDCCSETGAHKNSPRKHHCPVDGRECRSVHVKTMLHHLREPWKIVLKDQGYYYCSDPDCEVVYFGQDGITFTRSALRTRVDMKEDTAESVVCYCFGVTRREAGLGDAARVFVEKMTSESVCSCETSNPSGRCCLSGFPGYKSRQVD